MADVFRYVRYLGRLHYFLYLASQCTIAPPLAILIGIVVALAIGFAIELHDIFKSRRVAKENEIAHAKKLEEERIEHQKNFCEDCRNFQIFSADDLKSPEKKQRFQLIAKKHHLDDLSTEELLAILKEGEADYAAEQQQKQEEQRQALEKKLEEERQQMGTLQLFARFHGVDKTQAMLADELILLRDRISCGMSTPPAMIPKLKESDGMFAAGTAYGIGGVVPAAASLVHTAQKNAEIRQANAQIDQLNSALVGAVAMANANRMKNARRIKSFRDTFFSKCGYMKIDESSESIFSHLKFSHTEAIVSETGTVTVKTKVTTDGKVTAFGKSAYADGTVIAGIYSAGVKIGEATLVFPILGTGNLNYRQRVFDWDGKDESVELTGICLTCGAVPTLSYTVRFAPCDLWAINRSFL